MGQVGYLSVSVDDAPARDGSVQSVDRAISILQVLSRRRMAGVTEIANELSVHKSTVSRLLGTLEARGLVEQAASRGRYRLSYGIVQLAQGASKKHDITVVSRPVCDALAEEVGETVNVVVNEGRSVVTIDQVIGSSSVTTVNWVGKHNPLHVTSSGKVFLANMSRDELQSYLDGDMTRFTPYSIVGRAELETELAAVRKNGYASTFEEQEIGLVAIAAPIRDLDGRVIAALTVSGPTFRIDREAIPKIADRLLPAAAQISERNGYPKAG